MSSYTRPLAPSELSNAIAPETSVAAVAAVRGGTMPMAASAIVDTPGNNSRSGL